MNIRTQYKWYRLEDKWELCKRLYKEKHYITINGSSIENTIKILRV